MNSEEKILKQVNNFIKGGDNSDIEILNQALHDKYINIQNGFFGEQGIYVINKERYCSLITKKTFGGIPRTMEINSIDIEGNIAMVKVALESPKLKFKSFISLVQLEDMSWKVVGNFPHVIPNL